jgi:hypothetical protein
MPRNFSIRYNERGRWVASDETIDTGHGVAYRAYSELWDHLRNRISKEGLVMGPTIHEDTGSRGKALESGEIDDRRPMLYSAESLKMIEAIRERLGQVLSQHALDLAKQDGRRLVTDDDVLAALDRLDIAEVYADTVEEDDDER